MRCCRDAHISAERKRTDSWRKVFLNIRADKSRSVSNNTYSNYEKNVWITVPPAALQWDTERSQQFKQQNLEVCSRGGLAASPQTHTCFYIISVITPIGMHLNQHTLCRYLCECVCTKRIQMSGQVKEASWRPECVCVCVCVRVCVCVSVVQAGRWGESLGDVPLRLTLVLVVYYVSLSLCWFHVFR